MREGTGVLIFGEEAAYWRTVPHGFVPANRGRQYCHFCADHKRRAIHLDREALEFNDPRKFAGYERPTGRHGEVWWGVSAWNDGMGAGACHYGFDHRTGPMTSKGQAEAYLAHLIEHGDERGKVYAHYAVTEIRHESVATQLVHAVVSGQRHEPEDSEF